MCFAAAAHAGSLIDAPAFSASPAELLAAAKAAPADSDVYVIARSADVALDPGRDTDRYRIIFVVRTQAGIAPTSDQEQTYTPPLEGRPTIRARVIDPSGQVSELDAATIADTLDNRVPGTDRHRVVAHLPNVVVGSVVELELVTTESSPWHAGDAAETRFDGAWPSGDNRLTISAPAGTRVRFAEHLLPNARARHVVANGREQWSYVLGPQSASPVERGQPDDDADVVAVTYSTITSWNALARELGASIDARLAAGPPTWPSAIDKAPTLATARAVIAWVRAHAAVVPGRVAVRASSFPAATPADTVAHGGGDGLSVAALVVALLRQASLPADVALTRVAPGGDLAALPGTLAFDHALVRARIAGADVWMDPSAGYAPVGELMPGEHGRKTLILSDATTAPVTTPPISGADNTIREVHTYELTGVGPAKLEIVRREQGDIATLSRAYAATRSADDRKSEYGSYVADSFRGELVSFAESNLAELDRPLERTLGIANVGRTFGDAQYLGVAYFPAHVLDELPDELRTVAGTRVHPYRFRLPYSHEIENRFVVPDGYAMPSPAPDHVRALGALRVVEQQRVDGRTFVATYRLEPMPAQLSAADFETTRAAVAAWLQESAATFTFPSTAFQLHSQHRDREAIAEATRVANLHPRDALAHERLARLEIELGAGAAARREARLATQLEPKRARAWLALGWMLERDSFGYLDGFDCDRAGARAAYETARKLEPKDIVIAATLASFLELDERDLRVTHGPELEAALALRREVQQQDPNDDHEVALARGLFWSGKLADAEALLRSMAPGKDRDQLLVMTLALGPGGSEAARHEADALATGDAREDLLVSAAATAFYMRSYHVARQLLGPFHGSGAETMMAWAEHATRFDTPFKLTADPRSVAVEAAFEAIDAKRARVVFWDADVANAFMLHTSWATVSDDTSLEAMEDVARGMIMQVDGDADAWRVDATMGNARQILYLAREHGTPKLVATSELTQSAGRHVLRLLASGKDSAALRMLDWVVADDRPKVLAAVWGKDEPRDHARMLIAGALLASQSDGAHALPIIESCSLSTKEGQRACDVTAIQILAHDHRWSDALDRSVALEAAEPDFMYARTTHIASLRRLGRLDEAVRVASAAPARIASETPLALERMFLAKQRGKLDEARTIAEDVMGRASATSGELNEAAWSGLFVSANLHAVDAAARRASKLAPRSPGFENTLALAELEEGRLDAGLADELASMRLRHPSQPAVADWYVMARYYDLLGLPDDAVAAYRKVTAPKSPDPGHPSLVDVAAKRIAALSVTH
jgi:Flp pilus assembly protein TadD